MASKKERAQSAEYSIVVGLDLTPSSTAVLADAIAIAGTRPAARIHAVHAMDTTSSVRSAKAIVTLDHLLDRAAKALRTAIDRAIPDPAARALVVAHVRRAAAADAIIQVAVDVDADLVVVGTAPRTGIARLTQASVSAKVLKSAPCPVLLSRPKSASGREKTPRIEPVCKACRAKRAATNGASWWCDLHAERAATHAHVYSYNRELSLSSKAARGGH